VSLRPALFAALLTLAPAGAAAQELALMAGRAEYDLSGVRTSNVWAVRWTDPVRSFLVTDWSVTYIHTRQQFGRSDFWLPESQFQVQGLWGAFAPYLGAGIGLAIDDPDDDALDTEVDLATSAAVGVRLAVAERIGLRVDGRLHGIEIDYTGTVAGLTAGVTIGF
jgi:hypothetical protein